MTKIKEWWDKHFLFILGILGVIVVVGFTVWLSHTLFLIATTPDQPKMSIAETEDSLFDEWYTEYRKIPKFNPATMEVVRVDTVGWKRIQIIVDSYVIEGPISISRWGDTTRYTGTWHTIYDSVGVFILDSTIVPKTSPLLTIEQNEKLKDLLGRSTVKEKK